MTEQQDLLPEDRMAKLEARMDAMNARLREAELSNSKTKLLIEQIWGYLLLILRWAYSHCKGHGHTLRLNDFLVAGNEIKRLLPEPEPEE